MKQQTVLTAVLIALLAVVFGWLREPRGAEAALSTTKTFAAQTATGQTAALDLKALGVEGDRVTAQLNVTGGPATCTYQIEGSLDNSFYDDFSGAIDCTASVILHLDGKPADWLRGNLTALTGGASPTVTLILKAVGR